MPGPIRDDNPGLKLSAKCRQHAAVAVGDDEEVRANERLVLRGNGFHGWRIPSVDRGLQSRQVGDELRLHRERVDERGSMLLDHLSRFDQTPGELSLGLANDPSRHEVHGKTDGEHGQGRGCEENAI